MKVFIYRNLTKKCFSVMAKEGPKNGLVIGHCSKFIVKSATYKVSETGRQRVITTRRKDVHAGIEGELILDYKFGSGNTVSSILGESAFDLKDVTYNPYKAGYFYDKLTLNPIHYSDFAWGIHGVGNDISVVALNKIINDKTIKTQFGGVILQGKENSSSSSGNCREI